MSGGTGVAGNVCATRRGAFSICLVIASVCFAGASARAQVEAGEITGVVKDKAGASVPGATITVTEMRTNRQRVVVSTEKGVYTAASLAPAEYSIDVELSGFAPVRREGLRITTGEKAHIDFDLSVGGIQERVTVVGDSPIVRAETASLGTVIENEQVQHLQMAVPVKHPVSGDIRLVGEPVNLSRTPAEIVAPVAEMGEHTEEILAEIGIGGADIGRLRASKVI